MVGSARRDPRAASGCHLRVQGDDLDPQHSLGIGIGATQHLDAGGDVPQIDLWQPIDRGPVDAVGPGDIHHGLARIDTLPSLTGLVSAEGRRPTEPNTPGLGSLAALAGPGADRRPSP